MNKQETKVRTEPNLKHFIPDFILPMRFFLIFIFSFISPLNAKKINLILNDFFSACV